MTGRAPADVGARIRRIRLAKRLSQSALARPQMSTGYLSLIESGQRSPSGRALAYLASKLEVDVEELETGRPSGITSRIEADIQQARHTSQRGDLDAAERLAESAISDADAYHLGRLQAKASCVLASIHQRRGDYLAARELYDAAQDLLREDPPHIRFEAVVGHARCTRFLGDTKLAIFLLEQYLKELERAQVEDPTALMRVHAALVHFYRAVGLDRRSIHAAEEALRLAPSVEDPEQIACMSMNVARSLMDQGRHDDALDALRRAEQIYHSFDWPLPMVQATINKGIVALDKGQLDEARSSFRYALEVLERTPGQRSDEAEALDLLGRTERLLGNHETAITYLQRARKVLTSDDVFERAVNARELGLAMAESEPAAAERELRRSADAFQTAGAAPDAARVMLELGRLLLRQGDAEGAARVMEDGLELTATAGP